MSRGFPIAKVVGSSTFRTAGGLLFAGTVLALWFLSHPARPLFGNPSYTPSHASQWGTYLRSLAAGTGLVLALIPSGLTASRLFRLERPSPLLLIGMGLVYGMTVSFLLLAAGWFRPLILLGCLLFPGLPAFRKISEKTFRPSWLRRPALPTNRITLLLMAVIALAIATVGIRSFAPLTSNDSLVYHQTLAAEYAATGRFHAPPESIYGRMPHGGDLFYAAGVLFGGEGAALTLHLLLFIGNVLLGGALARSIYTRPGRDQGRNGPDSGAVCAGGALITASLPLFLDPRTVGNVDLIASYLFGTALLLLIDGRPSSRPGRSVAAAALLGGGLLTIKLSAYLTWPLLLAAIFLPRSESIGGGRIDSPAERVRSLVLFILISHAVLLPWLIKGWIESGSPLFPAIFVAANGASWDLTSHGRLHAWQFGMGPGRTPIDWLLLPWRIVMQGQQGYRFFDGILSPALIAAVPLIVAAHRRSRTLLLMTWAGIMIWGIGSQQLRFLAPVVLLASALAGGACMRKGYRPRWLPPVVPILLTLVAAATIFPYGRETLLDTLPVVTGSESRKSYLSRKVQSYDALRGIAEYVLEGERVFMVFENRVYYSSRPYFADSFFEASQVVRLAEKEKTAGNLIARLKQEGFDWVIVNRPLQRVFAKGYPSESIEILDDTWSRCVLIASWKGIELYRLPG